MFWREVVLFFPVLYDFVSCFIVDVMIMPFVHASLGVFYYSIEPLFYALDFILILN